MIDPDDPYDVPFDWEEDDVPAEDEGLGEPCVACGCAIGEHAPRCGCGCHLDDVPDEDTSAW